MIGLRCLGDLDKNKFKMGDDSFKEHCFKDYEKLAKGNLEIAFC